jgi:flagellar biosynthesis protein FlhG
MAQGPAGLAFRVRGARRPLLDWFFPPAEPAPSCNPCPPTSAAVPPRCRCTWTCRRCSCCASRASRARRVAARQPGLAAGLIDALVDLSSRDALTGLANRRSFELALAREVDRVARSGEPALLLVLDIDHFKRVNDTHGHAAGDQVIKAVATRCWTACGRWTWWRASAARSSPSSCPTARRPSAPDGGRAGAPPRRARAGAVGPGGSRCRSRSASAAPSRRSGCAPPRRCGSSAPTSSSTAPRPRAATWCCLEPRPCLGGQQRGKAAAVRDLPVPGSRMMTRAPDASRPGRHPAPRASLAVTSGKGGVGKTFVAANLAAALARRASGAGARRRPGPGQPRRGAEPAPQDHAARRLHRQGRAGRGHPAGAGRLLGAAGRLGHGRVFAPDARGARAAAAVIDEVAPRYDHVLLDTGAGISDVVLYTVSLADEVLVVATPEPTSLTDAYATIKVLATTQGAARDAAAGQPGAPPGEGRRAPAAAAGGRPLRQPGAGQPVRLDLLGEVPADPPCARRAARQLLLEVHARARGAAGAGRGGSAWPKCWPAERP